MFSFPQRHSFDLFLYFSLSHTHTLPLSPLLFPLILRSVIYGKLQHIFVYVFVCCLCTHYYFHIFCSFSATARTFVRSPSLPLPFIRIDLFVYKDFLVYFLSRLFLLIQSGIAILFTSLL